MSNRHPTLTRQGVRNLDLIGPRPQRRKEHVHTWTPWSYANEDMGGIVYETRECVSCRERQTRTWDPFAMAEG
jgi:hypothetical protein